MGLASVSRLELEDGSTYVGVPIGARVPASAEVVFTTGMSGYTQSLTDPSYRGQILVLTYPLAGNYGVPGESADEYGLPREFESGRIQVSGLVVGESCDVPSHFSSAKTLSRWLEESGVPGIAGIDTRALTHRLREHGVMRGRITHPGDHASGAGRSAAKRGAASMDAAGNGEHGHLVAQVSCRAPVTYSPRGQAVPGARPPGKEKAARAPRILLIDCGVKANLIRILLARGVEVIRVPWDSGLKGLEYDGILVSNGPGDPKACGKTIAAVRQALQGNKPVFGVCLGNQILALAAGADTYKLPYGHRGQNQPCRETGTDRCYITSQNHGYAVKGDSLPPGWRPWFLNANDGTIEGIASDNGLFKAVQFHPEGCPGPRDTEFLLDGFIGLAAGLRG